MDLHPDRHAHLEQKRRALQQKLREEEEWSRRFGAVRYEAEVLERRGVAFRVDADATAAWRWLEQRFPIRTRGLCDAFIDWTSVENAVLTVGEPQPDPKAWLRSLQTAERLGNPEVLLTWNFDLALRVQLDDVIENADVAVGRPEVWVLCPDEGWVTQFLPHEWDGWGWGRSPEG